MTNTIVPDEVLKTDVLGRLRTPVERRVALLEEFARRAAGWKEKLGRNVQAQFRSEAAFRQLSGVSGGRVKRTAFEAAAYDRARSRCETVPEPRDWHGATRAIALRAQN